MKIKVNNRMKKLLIMGGPRLVEDIVIKAKEKNIYTIVTDWYEPKDSPAKLIADEYQMISTRDIEGMTKFIKKEKIDAVITSFIESALPFYADVCGASNLPCYATREQFEMTMDKDLFKKVCSKYGIPTVKEYEIEECLEKDNNISFPVIVKPVDNSGARGISVCNSQNELKDGIERALSFSASDKVIIEKFMSPTKPGVNIDYIISNGKAYLYAVGDLFVSHINKKYAPLTAGVYYPSHVLDEYISNVHPHVIKMFESLKIMNGFIFIQSFYDEEGFHFYEMGYRLGGGQSYHIVDNINGTNSLDFLLNFAISGQMGTEEQLEKINPHFEKVGLGLVVLIRCGKVCEIRNLEAIRRMKEVVNIMQQVFVGDVVQSSAEGTLQQVFARIHLVADDKISLKQAVKHLKKRLEIIDENGNNMIIDNFDVDSLDEV